MFDTSDDDFCVAEVTCWGEYDLREDPDTFEGYYELYAFSDMYIDRFMTREEIIEKMLNANELDVLKFLRTFTCTDDEIRLFADKFKNNYRVLMVILYYHYHNEGTYYMEPNDAVMTLWKEMNIYGQDNNKGRKRE